MDKRSEEPLTEHQTDPFYTIVWTPAKVAEAWKKKIQYKEDALFIAGGTFIQLQREKGTPLPKHMISLEQIKEMKGITKEESEEGTFLKIGALTTLAGCLRDDDLKEHYPFFIEAVKNVAAPAVRSRGTIGGNISYGKGDIIPALLVLQAKVTYFIEAEYITEPIEEYMDAIYGKDQDPTSRLLLSVSLPFEEVQNKPFRFYKKVGRREAFTASMLTVACSGELDLKDGMGTLKNIRLACGGGDHHPERLVGCEKLLEDTVYHPLLMKDLYDGVMEEFSPMSDPFSSASYKKKVAANIMVSEFHRLIEQKRKEE
ncbi:FAD binding domain-containing protein [Thalassorhabdus alkalitolerans]|uniref:FAD binding domain-containing protein n=1 Tax=Thalassorhabdus alkalitolerans TaxID=2282697 RepID=A0ABW0YU82_9BACI